MKKTHFRSILALSLLVLGTGCASITGSKMQPVSVQTIQNNVEVLGAGCTLTNDNGRWFVTSPGSVTIQKSTADLVVECNKANVGAGNEIVVSKANGNVWGNLLIGGPIGYVMDRTSGAGFDYPTIITVTLRALGELIGLAPDIENAKSQPIQQDNVNSPTAQRLKELLNLRNDNLISEEEFQSKRKLLLEKM